MLNRHVVDTSTRSSSVEVLSAGEETAQLAIWTANALIDRRKVLRAAFKTETVTRMATQVPAWNTFGRIEFLVSIANLLDTASMTAAQTLARDIFIYARDTAIPKVNAAPDQAALDAIDPTAADPFGDGTPWPT